MAEALLSKPENQKPTKDIPKSRELFSGDINDAVIKVQLATGLEIDPEWWLANVGNEGSTESILDRFDTAYAELMASSEPDIAIFDEQRVHPEYDEKVIWDMLEKKSPDDIKTREQEGYAHLTYLDQAPTPEIKQTVHKGLSAIEQRLGSEVTQHILGGLEVIVGHDLESEKGRERGGRAFPHRKLVILNGSDTQITLGALTEQLDEPHRPSEYAEDFGNETKSGTITMVHEIGHVFDALVHNGNYGGDRQVFNGHGAPTRYGQTGIHEDYAESFTLFILDPESKRLSLDRKAAIERDIELIKSWVAQAR